MILYTRIHTETHVTIGQFTPLSGAWRPPATDAAMLRKLDSRPCAQGMWVNLSPLSPSEEYQCSRNESVPLRAYPSMDGARMLFELSALSVVKEDDVKTAADNRIFAIRVTNALTAGP